ncbi:MAG: histidine phosphatase family protein [Bariatricus sp.]|nr:histidine phosphatase family protein [Bariatricus sp.]
MEIILIRHFKTKGNFEKRYIGRTDEPIYLPEVPCQLKLEKNVEQVIVSPMMRCRQSAELLFPGKAQIICEEFKETDFGEFEGKNYLELTGNPKYQRWIDSGGTLPFPGGESREQFRIRCVSGFEKIMDELLRENCHVAAFVVHGGTIMSLLSEFDLLSREFYHWKIKNGEGFQTKICVEDWKAGKKYFTEIKKL